MPEEQQPEQSPAPTEKRNPHRRGRRGGRGRGRGHAPREIAKETPSPAEPAQPTESVDASVVSESAPIQERKPEREVRRETPPPPPTSRHFSASAIADAISEVNEIVESLEQTLEQMEDVLKLLQTAEQQKIGDEREIESLRRALRRIQPPRNQHPERPPEESAG